MATTNTTLNGAISAGQNTVTLTAFTNPSVGGISVPTWLLVDGEYMLVTNASLSPTLVVARGWNGSPAATHNGLAPVAYGLASDFAVPNSQPIVESMSVNGAITIPKTSPNLENFFVINKAGVCALTLAAPAADQNGLKLSVSSNSANAHTVTATGLFQTGAATVNLATFAAFAGASFTVQALNGKWNVISQNAVTFT